MRSQSQLRNDKYIMIKLADALTKKGASKTKLLQALESTKLFNEERHLEVKTDYGEKKGFYLHYTVPHYPHYMHLLTHNSQTNIAHCTFGIYTCDISFKKTLNILLKSTLKETLSVDFIKNEDMEWI